MQVRRPPYCDGHPRASHHGLVLASRNAQDSAGLDLDVFTPWGVA